MNFGDSDPLTHPLNVKLELRMCAPEERSLRPKYFTAALPICAGRECPIPHV